MSANTLTWKVLVPFALILIGCVFSWRLLNIPSRMETAAFMILLFGIPTLKYPKFGVYFLFCAPLFIPMFRRMYYLLEARPTIDHLMLISDGVMAGFICALALLWLLNKSATRDPLPILILCYITIILIKVFVGNELAAKDGILTFKLHGLYIFFFFAGSYILTSTAETRKLLFFVSCNLLITSLYAIRQVLFGFADFEQKWMDSITFTTLYIEGVVRPFSTYVSPATLSDGMTILLITGAYWFISKGRHLALFGIILAASSVWPLLIATVRTNWLAAAAGLVFYTVWLRIRKGWLKGVLMALGLLAVVGGAMKSGGGADQYQSQALQRQIGGGQSMSEIMIKNRTQALANPLQEYSMQKRMQTWGWIWMKAMRNPFGSGTGTTGYAHSFYFQMLGETGFAGILIYLSILFITFKRGFAVVARGRDPAGAEITRYLLTLVFMISILNLTGTHLHTSPGDIFFWFSLGCIHRFHARMASEEKEEEEEAALAAVQAAAAAEAARPGSDPHAVPSASDPLARAGGAG